MANISQIKTDTDWQEAAGTINTNFANVSTAIEGLKQTTSVKMPLFSSTSEANSEITNKYVGQLILVGSTLPAPVYRWNGSSWVNTGTTGGNAEVPLSDYLGYDNLGNTNEVSI